MSLSTNLQRKEMIIWHLHDSIKMTLIDLTIYQTLSFKISNIKNIN